VLARTYFLSRTYFTMPEKLANLRDHLLYLAPTRHQQHDRSKNMIPTVDMNQRSFGSIAKEGCKITLSASAGLVVGTTSAAVIYVTPLAATALKEVAYAFLPTWLIQRRERGKQFELKLLSYVMDTDPVKMKKVAEIHRIVMSVGIGGFTTWFVGNKTYEWLTEQLG
jgi:hypothetical protein